jgi:DNA mismatch repair protein MutL
LDFDRDANLDTPYHYKDLEVTPPIQVDGSFNPFRMIKSISITQVRGKKTESTASWESRGIKTRRILFLVILIFPLKVKR